MSVNDEVVKQSQKERELLNEILLSIRSIRYGYVQIIVQDSKVVQIDKTEKIRLDKTNERSQI